MAIPLALPAHHQVLLLAFGGLPANAAASLLARPKATAVHSRGSNEFSGPTN